MLNFDITEMNKRITVNISTNIHNESIKVVYIPSYISANRVQIFINLKKQNLQNFNECLDIYNVQIFTMTCISYRSLNVGWEQKSVRIQKCLSLYLLKMRMNVSLIHVKVFLKLVKATVAMLCD